MAIFARLKTWFKPEKIHRLKLTNRFTELLICYLKILFGKLERSKMTAKLEEAFGGRYKCRDTILFPHARIALHFILKSLGLKQGDEVIMAPLTIADMVNSIHAAGLKPVFVDVELDTFGVDPGLIEKNITPRTKVLFVTYLFGIVPDIKKIMEIARKHGLIVIEDCSQNLNASYEGQLLGTFGDASIFSLTNFKVCSALFGGMVICNNEKIIDKLKYFRDNALHPPQADVLLRHLRKNMVYTFLFSKWVFSYFTYFIMFFLEKLSPDITYRLYSGNIRVVLGEHEYNLLSEFPSRYLSGFTDAQAYVGMRSLARADHYTSMSIRNGDLLRTLLSDIPNIKVPVKIKGAHNVYWRFPIISNDRDGLKRLLLEHGIDSAPTFLALLSREPGFSIYQKPAPNAERFKKDVLVVEVNEDLSEETVRLMASLIRSHFLTLEQR